MPHGSFENGEHHQQFTVYYEDTDAGGVVYHANYLKFAERARTDALRALNIHQLELRAKEGLIFVVSQCRIRFLSPAFLDDRITIRTRLLALGKVRMTMEQMIYRDDTLLTSLEVDVAMLDKDNKPTRIPEAIAKSMRESLTTNA